jgi:hypothetical protein
MPTGSPVAVDDSEAARVLDAARLALAAAHGRTSRLHPTYTCTVEENLVEGVSLDLFCADFAGAGGHELTGRSPEALPKFCATHSSAALAVNTFARWKRDLRRLRVFEYSDFDTIRFEARCPSGLGGTPPTLDLLGSSPRGVLAVESKCLEYLGRHEARVANAYLNVIGPWSDSPWFRELQALRADARKYHRLDASQLIKHSLGLWRTFLHGQPQDPDVTLLYLFWEPANWLEIPPCIRHREEVVMFAQAVAGDRLSFRWGTYRDLWAQWQTLLRSDDWLATHTAALRARYDVGLRLSAGCNGTTKEA